MLVVTDATQACSKDFESPTGEFGLVCCERSISASQSHSEGSCIAPGSPQVSSDLQGVFSLDPYSLPSLAQKPGLIARFVPQPSPPQADAATAPLCRVSGVLGAAGVGNGGVAGSTGSLSQMFNGILQLWVSSGAVVTETEICRAPCAQG